MIWKFIFGKNRRGFCHFLWFFAQFKKVSGGAQKLFTAVSSCWELVGGGGVFWATNVFAGC